LTLPIDASDLVSVPLLREELLLATYPSHPLAAQKRIVPADLEKQPFVLFETGSVTRRIVADFFERERIAPPVIMETENVEIIKAMVRSGLGISIIPWQAAAADVSSGQLFCSRIAGVSLERQTGWLYPKMGRLPRALTEVMRVFETMRPQFEATVHPSRV
jgi:DNA-binding transcriptional LysR family regulator